MKPIELIRTAYAHALTIMLTPGTKAKLSLWRDCKAQTGTIMALVTAGIMILIGVINDIMLKGVYISQIFANVKNAMPAVNDAAANTSLAAVATVDKVKNLSNRKNVLRRHGIGSRRNFGYGSSFYPQNCSGYVRKIGTHTY